MITTTATAYDRVTERLEAVTGYAAPRPGGDWRCPAHNDGTASLSVTPTPDRVLLRCHALCTVDAIVAALGLTKADLFDKPSSNGNGKHDLGPVVATYPYVDDTGATVLEVVRYAPKTFRQRVPDPSAPGGYRWKLPPSLVKPLYRLPSVLDAVKHHERVWITEGEKDVEAFEAINEVATCNPGGAGRWQVGYAGYFTGAEVYVVVDRDEAGRKHAQEVVESLAEVAGSVKVVRAAEGKDAADHLAAGLGLDEFVKIPTATLYDTAAFPYLEAPGTDDTGEVGSEADSANERAIANPFRRVPLDVTTRPTPRPTIGSYLYRGGLTVMQSEPGVGKTWLALTAVLQVLAEGGTALYFDEEGGDDLMRERLYALGAAQADIAERFHYFPFEARQWTDDDLDALEAMVIDASKTGPIQLAVFDSLPDFLAAAGLSEDSAKDVTTFINRVCGRLRQHGISQLALDHLTKPPSGDKGKKERSRYSRGSGAKLAKVDATVLIESAEPFDATRSGRLRLWKTKDRYGRLDVPRMDEPGRLLDVTVGDGTVRITASGAVAEPKWAGPTECVQKVTELLRTVGTTGLTSNKIVEGVRMRRQTVQAALDQMAREGVIRCKAGARNSLVWYLDDGVEQIYLDLVDTGSDSDGQ